VVLGKFEITMTLKQKAKDILFLLYDSGKALVTDFIELISSLKQAKTWSFILYAVIIIAAYTRNLTLMKVTIPFILILFVARRNQDPSYHAAVRRRAFNNNDLDKLEKYYRRYIKDCKYSRPPT